MTPEQEADCTTQCAAIWKVENSWNLSIEDFLGFVNLWKPYDPGEEEYRSPDGSVLTSGMVTHWITHWGTFRYGFRLGYEARLTQEGKHSLNGCDETPTQEAS